MSANLEQATASAQEKSPKPASGKMTCLVVDDDPIARSLLESLIAQHQKLELLQSFDNSLAALQYLSANDADLVFLDIEMPEMTGLEFLDALDKHPLIILTTSKENYAIKAFEYKVTDYLLKPIRPARFLQAVNHAFKVFEEKQKTNAGTTGPLPPKWPQHIFVRFDNQFVKIDLTTVQWVEARGDYIDICTDEKKMSIHARMMDIEPKLPEEHFIRVHRSYIVNISKITVVQDNMLVIGQKVIPISKNNRTKLMETLNLLS